MKRIFLSAAAAMIVIGLGCAGADLAKAPRSEGTTEKVPSGYGQLGGISGGQRKITLES